MSQGHLKVNSNSKLGREGRVGSFNLPAVDTCPGASELCLSHCYAKKGNFATRSLRVSMERSLAFSRTTHFVERMVAEIHFKRPSIVRLHSSGDFYSPEYARKWADIAAQCPGVAFCAYTRSWSMPGFNTALRALDSNMGFNLFLSVDESMGTPPDGFRLAHMRPTLERMPDSFLCPNQVQTHRNKGKFACKVCGARYVRGETYQLGEKMVKPRFGSLCAVCGGKLGSIPSVTCGDCKLCYRSPGKFKHVTFAIH